MQIQKLAESTRSLMRSSFILTDLNSIVDELIANSLDAKATNIVISINLDTYCLTVQDNGDGITHENMTKIAERHHTSKDVQYDMRGITSLGYRGEALSSLSQISSLQIISKNRFNYKMCSKLMRGGKVIVIKQNINDPKFTQKHGTTIIVKDMFFNLKIRREQIFGPNITNNKNGKKGKKSKSNATFKRNVSKLHSNLVKWCVAHYDIKFILKECDDNKMNKIICKSQGYSSPKFVLSSMIDPDLIKYLHDFDSDDLFDDNNNNDNDDDIRIWGVICDVRRLYHKKNWQLIFINKRCIQHHAIYKNIYDFLMKMHKCFKSDLNIDSNGNDGHWNKTNITINSSLTQSQTNNMIQIPSKDRHDRVPWYQYKQNQHHQHPIFAVFIETNPQNVMMENDTKKLHVLIKNEESVLKKLKSTLLRMAHKMYPSLRLMDSWRDEFSEIIDDNIDDIDDDDDDDMSFNNNNNNNQCGDVVRDLNSVIMRDEKEEEEEKLISEDKTPHSPQPSVATLPLNECGVMTTPSTSPSRSLNEIESPSPPWQIAKKRQKQLYLWSMQRKKKRKRNECNDDNDCNDDIISSPKKKRKECDEYFNDDLDELISTNTTFMDDHFPPITQNQNKIGRRDTESVVIANQQTANLMNSILPTLAQENNTKTINGENLFGFNLPDFNALKGCNHNNNDNDNDKDGKKQNDIMDIIDGEVKLCNILAEWQSKYDIEENDIIPVLKMGSSDITVSKQDLSNLSLFGIGQINKKWIVTRLREYIILIDQHAADERVRVERLTSFIMSDNGPNSYRIKSTKLQIPYEIYIDNEDLQTLNINSKWIKNWGFQYQVMNGSKIKIFQTPLIYGTRISVDELREILTNINRMNSDLIQKYIPKCIERVLASKACRSAIKFGDKLKDKEMRNLLKKLSECKLPYQCAHGRPTLFPIADLNEWLPEYEWS